MRQRDADLHHRRDGLLPVPGAGVGVSLLGRQRRTEQQPVLRGDRAWLDTTTSSARRAVSSSDALLNVTRPASRGQSPTSAPWSTAVDGGKAVSTTTAEGDESSRSNMTCARRPWPPAMSMTRPPRSSRRARRATCHASYSSLRGRHPAAQTVRPSRSNSVSPENRPRSYGVSRARDEGEKCTPRIVRATPCPRPWREMSAGPPPNQRVDDCPADALRGQRTGRRKSLTARAAILRPC